MELFNNINIGIVSKCNAKCYLCNRNCIEGFPLEQEMKIETFSKILPFTKRIQIIGGFGDFINHSRSLDIINLIKEHKKCFLVETNGAIGSESYWKELGALANSEEQTIQFSIDDIENEFNPYRKVKTATVLKNLEIFLNAGGHARVKTLLFKFNEDQIEKMKLRFADVDFTTQQSMFYPKTGLLAAPSHIKHEGSIASLNALTKATMRAPKSCPWQDGKWALVNELGEVHVCCYILTFLVGLKDKAPEFISEFTQKEYYEEVYELYIKNKELINLNNVGFKEAYENEYNKFVINNYKKIKRCQISCGINKKLKNMLQGEKF